jgi:hypothetical protein
VITLFSGKSLSHDLLLQVAYYKIRDPTQTLVEYPQICKLCITCSELNLFPGGVGLLHIKQLQYEEPDFVVVILEFHILLPETWNNLLAFQLKT